MGIFNFEGVSAPDPIIGLGPAVHQSKKPNMPALLQAMFLGSVPFQKDKNDMGKTSSLWAWRGDILRKDVSFVAKVRSLSAFPQ